MTIGFQYKYEDYFSFNNPHPSLPPRGKEHKQSLSPLGETGKRV
jgi:hypothetical protein